MTKQEKLKLWKFMINTVVKDMEEMKPGITMEKDVMFDSKVRVKDCFKYAVGRIDRGERSAKDIMLSFRGAGRSASNYATYMEENRDWIEKSIRDKVVKSLNGEKVPERIIEAAAKAGFESFRAKLLSQISSHKDDIGAIAKRTLKEMEVAAEKLSPLEVSHFPTFNPN